MTTTTSVEMRVLPRLLQLPLELRQDIYLYLCPADPISNPIPTVGITCVSHRPPSTALLLASRAVNVDVQAYYHSIANWKLIASHAFNFYRIDPTLSNFASSRLLTRMQKVELVFWFDGSLLKSYPSLKQKIYCDEIRKRAIRACDILATAPNLKVLRVSWVDTTTNTPLEEKKNVLDALSILDGKVRFEIGVLEWSNAQASPEKDTFESQVKSLIEATLPVAAC
ncbi:hypothetical protein AUEXF2481DRAFT_34126 [Aureobasidium subglaciale EXF-2481]|uniref:Uncharacterized protein n=1 Tax=Aureobasidium subglaciale (strain EXF-2481) TaxID=1043005 RepID=A0A074YTV2_AURSE|nr:uncharacterized protein AUEXF2481DRAFT_34126 [Aureobasidium subglaciale EXF-2481]KAI5194509.1 hypothetical protein E4T38_09544 [Aureobasidium subglaciale]KAI5213741.1 hypothetical protein E4T40_09486 [Aureobasidium subglaciale]KAI5215640.1 hypothetical protein E4T41_09523 [Aureobasidium subglaciale]KAI5253673.1 hypothetical protein E4T46_09478 [Aureobasidium subglaciale]KEQ90276.1 hypothetical protein AUEXF2481DRAFT_34126 [Aureobasidium subglaciale EXF-2481]